MSINNNITIKGQIGTAIKTEYEQYDKKFISFDMDVDRLSGTTDFLHIVVDNFLLGERAFEVGERIEVKGEVRSRNELDDNGKNHTKIYVFASSIEVCNYDKEDIDDINDAALIGYVCNKPKFRQTPKGKDVCDFMIAVQRQTPNRADYIPCIAWGPRAKWCSKLEVGTKVALYGRLQSRIYHKDTDPRIAYEVSIMDVKPMRED